MKPVVIYGASQFAETAHYYLSTDSPYRVAAFTVDGDHLDGSRLCGLPVVPVEDLATSFPPERYSMFVAIGPRRVNALRAEKCRAVEAAGYELVSYVSSRATVHGRPTIHPNTFITDQTVVGPHARIGRGAVLWGARVAHHGVIGDYSLLSACLLGGGVTIGERTFVGLNATIRDQVRVGMRCVIGAGTLILRDTEDEQVFQGRSSRAAQVPSARLEGV